VSLLGNALFELSSRTPRENGTKRHYNERGEGSVVRGLTIEAAKKQQVPRQNQARDDNSIKENAHSSVTQTSRSPTSFRNCHPEPRVKTARSRIATKRGKGSVVRGLTIEAKKNSRYLAKTRLGMTIL
jgi:hypothetical protein